MYKSEISRTIRASLRAALWASILTPAIALADPVKVNVDAQPMSSALNRLAEQIGVQLVYDGELVSGMKARALTGTMEPSQALSRILEGSGLTFRFTSDKTVTLSKVPSDKQTRVLGPVKVEGEERYQSPARGEGVAQLGGVRGAQAEEAVGYRAKVASVTTGAPQAIEDVPRSITVLTQEQIQAQDIQDIGDALRRLPGVTLVEGVGDAVNGGAVYSRGYLIQKIQVDGGAPRNLNILGNGLLDVGAYERVEMVRGPNGMNTGAGSPGGSINFVRKRPRAVAALNVNGTFSTLDRRQAQIDYSTPDVFGSAIAFRGVASYDDQDMFYDNDHRKNSLLYGMFDVPLGADARLELGVQHTKVDESGYYQGLPRYLEGDLMPFPHDYNYVPPTAYQKAEATELFSNLYARLGEDWNVQIGFSYEDREYSGVQYLLSGGSGGILKATNQTPAGVIQYVDLREQRADQGGFGSEFRLAGHFETFGLTHDVLLGADYRDEIAGSVKEHFYNGEAPVRSILDLRPDIEFIPLGVLRPGRGLPMTLGWPEKFSKDSPSSFHNFGVTLNDTISWRHRVDFSVSARRYWSDSMNGGTSYDINNDRYTGFSYSETQEAPGWRPTWSLTLKPYGGFRIFGSYAEGFNSQSSVFAADRQPLGSLTFENREAGVKYGASTWEASVTAYKLERANAAQAIPGSSCPPTPTSVCFFRQGATERSSGVDVEGAGTVWRGLSVVGSYNRNHNKTVSTNLPITTRSPEEQAKLFLEWAHPQWGGSLLGGSTWRLGASYQGRVYESGTARVYDPATGKVLFSTPYEFAEPATTVYDMGLSQQLPHGFTVDLLVENLTNKLYYSTVGARANYAGPSRTTTLTVRWADQPSSSHPSTDRVPFGEPGNWYGRLLVGAGEPADVVGKSRGSTKTTWTFEADRGSASFVSLGYRFSNAWRTEVEASLKQTEFSTIGGASTAPMGVCGVRTGSAVAPGCDAPSADADVYSLLASLIRDFGSEGARVRPYLGLGVGPALYSMTFGGRMAGVGSNADGTGTAASTYNLVHGDSTTFSFAFQAQAGVTFRLTDRAQLDLAYRYLDLPNVDWHADTLPRRPVDLGGFEGSYRSNSLSLGLDWRF